ncbi:penicillin-binding transpeptidase domain-containing protein [Streptomyces umbrinus]|uniref:penicillin-binding transpeptidase domain-containing protein n=1 Tax=Streptomyces umbrinus TaxID=67370 RepID=UPI003C2E5BE2
MNKPTRRASVFCLLLILALLARVTWLQGVDGQSLADSPHNERTTIAEYAHPLGNIIVAGDPVTGSGLSGAGSGLKYKRTYIDGALYAPITGYSSQIYGSTGLQALYPSILDGTDSRLKTVQDLVTGESPKPGNVITTIDPAVQKAGYSVLSSAGDTGAAVAIDPSTGRILGMVSTPSYNPGSISGDLRSDVNSWISLTKSSSQPMENRAMSETYAPGSTFKLVVLTAALKSGAYTSINVPTDSPDPYYPPGSTVPVVNEEAALPCKNATLKVALELSCNTVFGPVAVKLGWPTVRATAKEFGFDSTDIDVPTQAVESVYPSDMDVPETAMSGFGQYDDRASPLQMAMVASAIANDGKLASPHMVTSVTDGNGSTLKSYPDGKDKTIMSPSIAKMIQNAMVGVVQGGTGTNARISGVEVGGKTGTAQAGVGNSQTLAWYVSWAKYDGKEVAVAAVVAHSAVPADEVSGNGLAAPICKAMMEAALGLKNCASGTGSAAASCGVTPLA